MEGHLGNSIASLWKALEISRSVLKIAIKMLNWSECMMASVIRIDGCI